jgi:DNA replication and repair protein RecF
MRLRQLTLQHFRNIPLATLDLRGRQTFLLGANGQGKTNLLEAAGFITALRSFRTAEIRLLIAQEQHEAGIAGELEHEQLGDTRLAIKLRANGRDLWWDDTRVTRLTDHLGKFPTVVFSSQDLLLVRGAPTGRRRWLDLTLAAMDADYLRSLQTYHRALAERNSLLKRAAHGGLGAEDELSAFEHIMAPAAARLIALRRAGLEELGGRMASAYAQLAPEAEAAALRYGPNHEAETAEAWLERWEQGRKRDLQFRTTLSGPHRDDFEFLVRSAAAKDFASEGQQRSLVIALRLAQAAWSQARSGVRPVLLADDVLGELDPDRRRRFWAAIDPQSQVIATGTQVPDAELGQWQIFSVVAGGFSENSEAMEGAS